MNCESCKYFEQHPEHDWIGNCTIRLPPQLQEAANNFSSSTRNRNGCDLWQPKEVEPEE